MWVVRLREELGGAAVWRYDLYQNDARWRVNAKATRMLHGQGWHPDRHPWVSWDLDLQLRKLGWVTLSASAAADRSEPVSETEAFGSLPRVSVVAADDTSWSGGSR